MEINLISDTVTRPTPDMLQYMMAAKVGDDVYKQDPTVNELEALVADLFGREAALFFPTGTMANQTAIKLLTRPGDELIADHYAHVYNYEAGGVAFNSGVSCRLIAGDRGRITAEQVAACIHDPEFYHSPRTSLVCVENTTNKGGGACYDIQELERIAALCRQKGLGYHLDGARLWNALVVKGEHPKQYGALFDTISVCLSKGLGAPMGSVLIGDAPLIKEALRIRKVLGGGMRQVGYMAAAGIYALENHIERLQHDHHRAADLGRALAALPWVHQVEPVETNIVIFSVKPLLSEQQVIAKFRQKGIGISALGPGKLRIVTHMDYREVMHTYVLECLAQMTF